jgi:hypothetical protein
MNPIPQPVEASTPLLLRLSQEGEGYTAQVVGIPELRAVGATRDEAVEAARQAVGRWFDDGRLVALWAPARPRRPKPAGWERDDPLEQEFLQELARSRQEDLERTLEEYEREDRGCSVSSSTPTT